MYALGAILYEMLTGKPPFESDSSINTIRQLLSMEPVRPSHLHPKVPRDLETICLKCLEKYPARRYASAEDLAEDLHRFLLSEPIEARATGRREEASNGLAPPSDLAALIGVVSLAVATMIGVGLAYHLELQKAVGEARCSAEENRQSLVHLHVAQGTEAMNAGDGFTALLWFSEARARLDPGTPEQEEPHRLRIAARSTVCPSWLKCGSTTARSTKPASVPMAAVYSRPATMVMAHLWDSEMGEMATPPMTHFGPWSSAPFSVRTAAASPPPAATTQPASGIPPPAMT